MTDSNPGSSTTDFTGTIGSPSIQHKGARSIYAGNSGSDAAMASSAAAMLWGEAA